jgi:uncharacterized membrane protein YraQ (UPF0718 family)
MTAFFLAMAALLAGIGLVPVLRSGPRVASALDGFVLTALLGLVVGHLIPESIADGGLLAVAAAVVGLFLPRLLEAEGLEEHGPSEPWAVLAVAGLGLSAHAFLDGTALGAASVAEHGGAALAAGVVLHKLPMGLVLGAVGGTGRRSLAWSAGALVVVATFLGFILGSEALPSLGVQGLAVLQALVAGTLAHVAVQAPDEAGDSPADRWAAAAGGLLGLGVMGAMFAIDDHGSVARQAAATFLDLLLDTAPALLVAFVGAAVLSASLGDVAVRWVGRGGPASQALKGMAVGLPIPVCSCGVLPVYESLARRGVPPAAGLAFLVATPELGVDAILVSIPLIGWELTIARVIAAAAVAWLVGVVVGRFASTPKSDGGGEASSASFAERLRERLKWAFTELPDHLLPWMALGLVIAAILGPLVEDGAIARLPAALQVPAATLAGLPLYVCATGSTPIAAVLVAKGLSPGAALAFLLSGPATNAATFGALSRLHGRSAAVAFAVAVGGGAMAAGYLVDALLPATAVAAITGDAHGAGPIAWLSLVGLTVVAATSVLRVGPRGWMASLGAVNRAHHHDAHDHDVVPTALSGTATSHDHGHDGHDHHGHGHDHRGHDHHGH